MLTGLTDDAVQRAPTGLPHLVGDRLVVHPLGHELARAGTSSLSQGGGCGAAPLTLGKSKATLKISMIGAGNNSAAE